MQAGCTFALCVRVCFVSSCGKKAKKKSILEKKYTWLSTSASRAFSSA